MEKNIVIVHFNTPLLTECLIHSINHFTPNTNIYIFDNSDKEPFTAKFDNVTIIDNTKGQIIDFDEWLKEFPNKVKNSHYNYASAKHCYTIQKCMDILQKNFLLLDSDILLKRDVGVFFQSDKIYVGETEKIYKRQERVLPYICFINTKMCAKHNILYFNGEYMHHLSVKGKYFDTRAYFFLNTKSIPHKNISINQYIIHFKTASWKNKSSNKNKSEFKWLLINEKLWNFNNWDLKERILSKCNEKQQQEIIKKEVIRKSTRQMHLLAKRKKLLLRRT